MSFSRFVFVTALALCTAPLSRAGLYVKGGPLFNQPSDVEVDNVSSFKASLKNNVGFATSLGYKFTMFRVEAELQYLRSGTERDESSGTSLGGAITTTGVIRETSGFANGFVDLPSFFGLSPYIGAGLGYARVELDDVGRTRNGLPTLRLGGREAVFGYQGMLGLQFHFLGHATIHGGYRIVKREDIAVRDVVANARQNVRLGDNRIFEIGLAIGF